jgi:hypothetical protein
MEESSRIYELHSRPPIHDFLHSFPLPTFPLIPTQPEQGSIPPNTSGSAITLPQCAAISRRVLTSWQYPIPPLDSLEFEPQSLGTVKRGGVALVGLPLDATESETGQRGGGERECMLEEQTTCI